MRSTVKDRVFFVLNLSERVTYYKMYITARLFGEASIYRALDKAVNTVRRKIRNRIRSWV